MNKTAIVVAMLALFLLTTLETVNSFASLQRRRFYNDRKILKRDVASNKAVISNEELNSIEDKQ